jgi:hypothetical protein
MVQGLSNVATLQEASEAKRMIRIWRRGVEKWPFDTYVLAMGKKFVLLQAIRERIDFDGYDAIRVEHITKIERCPREDFFRAALRLKRQRRRHPRGLNLDSAKDLLVSVNKAFPLAVIHREIVSKDECEIGQLKSVFASTYLLRSMGLVGAFQDDSTKYRFSDVTRVSFDGAYENTLALVAGL